MRELVGVKLNRLLVKEVVYKYNRRYLLCECECGNTTEVKTSHFTSSRIRSCGCYNNEIRRKKKGINKNLKPDNYAAKYRIFKRYENDARRRCLLFNLSLADFENLTSKNCYYCGTEPGNIGKSRQSRSTYVYNGIDRINNDDGYFIANCVPCCKICNIAKQSLTQAKFLEWVFKVADKWGHKLHCNKIP